MTIKGMFLASAAAALVGVPAFAQVSTTPQSDAGAPTKPSAQAVGQQKTEQGGLADIVVTARRRAESQQTVPVSVSVLSQDQLSRQNIVSAIDLQSRIPGLQARQQSASRDQISFRIRGQGQAQAGALPGVITYFLDVPTNAAGAGLLYDLDNVQVLKGPQGTLFGRNSTGGAILINPKKPDNQFGGYIDGAVGSLNLRRVQGAVNVPLFDDKIEARLAFDSNQRDGFTRNLTTGVDLDDRNYFSWRTSIVLRPIDGLEDYFVYNQFNSRTNGGSLVPLQIRPGSPAALLYPGLFAALAEQQARGIRTVAESVPINRDEVDSQAATNILTYRISDGLTFKNILGYRLFKQRLSQDSDGTIFPIIEQLYSSSYESGNFSDPRSQRTYSAEGQLQFKLLGGRVNGVIGGYIDKTDPQSGDNRDSVVEFGEMVQLISLRYDRSKAVFGQASLDLSSLMKGLSITAGGRYTKDNRELDVSDSSNGVCTTVLADSNCFRKLQTSFSKVTYNFSLEYKVLPKTLIYVATRKGYKGGGFNPGVAVAGAASYGPETVVDYEAGVKTDFRLAGIPSRFNVAAFTSNYNDIQRSTQQFLDGQAFIAITNSGNARIKGVEAEITVQPVPRFTLNGFYAYTNAKYLTPVLQTTPFQNTPANKAGLNATYTVETSYGKIIPSASYSYTSSFHASNNPDTTDIQAAYSTVDARLDWADVLGSPITIYGFVNNLTDTKYVTGMVNVLTAIGYRSASFSEPRTYGIGVRAKF